MAVESTKKRLRTTFKARVEKFWNWFPDIAKRFEAALAADNPQPVVDEVSAFMATNMPGLSWALGRGENELHSFTLTGEGQIDLPRGFYRELPKTDSGYPRVYEFARDLIVHSDSSMDAELIQRCTMSFQSRVPLSIGETWAVPIDQ